MQYEILKEVQPLKINFICDTLDVATLGILQLQLQEITDKVAYSSLLDDETVDPRLLNRFYYPRDTYFSSDSDRSYDRIIKAQVNYIRSGSLEQEVVFALSSILIDPDVRSVVLGVASNIVYAIGASGVEGVTKKVFGKLATNKTNTIDPFNISNNVRTILKAMASNGNSEKMILKISHQRGNEKVEVEIQIGR